MRSKIESEIVKALGKSFKGQKDGEADAKYRARVIRAANDMAEEDWGGLSTKAQEWVNTGIEALEAKTEVADFPDVEGAAATKKSTTKKATTKKSKAAAADEEDEDEEESEEEESEEEEEDEEESEEAAEEEAKPSKKSKAKKSKAAAVEDDEEEDEDEEEETESVTAKKSKKSKATTKKPKAPKAPKAPGVTGLIVEIVLRHPKWSKDKISEELKKKNLPFKDSTVQIQRSMTRRIIKKLQAAGKLKEEML